MILLSEQTSFCKQVETTLAALNQTKKAPAKYSVQLTVNRIWPKYEEEEDEEERNKEQT